MEVRLYDRNFTTLDATTVNTISFGGADVIHATAATTSDFTVCLFTDEPHLRMYEFDCRRGQLSLIRVHDYPERTYASGFRLITGDAHAPFIYMKGINVLSVNFGSGTMFFKNGEITDYRADIWTTSDFGFTQNPYDETKYAYMIGTNVTPYTLESAQTWEVTVTPEGTVESHEMIADSAPFGEMWFWPHAATSPYEDGTLVMAISDNDQSSATYMPMVRVRDVAGNEVAAIDLIDSNNFIYEQLDDVSGVTLGKKRALLVQETYRYVRQSDIDSDNWLSACVTLADHSDGSVTTDTAFLRPALLYPITQWEGEPGEWDSANNVLGSSLVVAHRDGVLIVGWTVFYNLKNQLDSFARPCMTIAWRFEFGKDHEFNIWDYNNDVFRSIGRGTYADTGQTNIKIDSSTWAHEWTTQDDIDNPTALRYPLKVNVAEDGEPPKWAVVGMFTPTL